MTDKYDPKNQYHRAVKSGIEIGNSLPDISNASDVRFHCFFAPMMSLYSRFLCFTLSVCIVRLCFECVCGAGKGSAGLSGF